MKEIGETSAGKEVGESVGKYAARRAEGSAYSCCPHSTPK